MPRTARASAGGYGYHVLNRGNGRATVFHKDGDYEAFLALIAEAGLRTPMRLIAYCLLPNHFHLAVWPHGDGDLSRWMHWLLTAHVRRYPRHYHSSGHIWRGRFKAFPIQEDDRSASCSATSSATRCAPGWSGGPSTGQGLTPYSDPKTPPKFLGDCFPNFRPVVHSLIEITLG